ncbi:ATP-dependent RNA helicase rhlE [Oligella ureolytica]|uniref:DEAD/DEAH box helicase n=1 Tax=Oligella ureolytica TaxID=90244 RepID=UPI000DF8C517|nr:DEAD/DEAH box helicase [Oligella ureolytica]SUA56801.1 ATP-dependent RNA helicase rhlE [Oligella ureolytica]
MSFESLGLAPVLLDALNKAGFTQPTEVQAKAIPAALEGKDLIVSAQTGSGKTAAFTLPALHRIATTPAGKQQSVRLLVLTPTRELAMQVADATKQYSSGMRGIRVATVVGGMPYGPQINALKRRVDVLVATPGRLIDHLNAGRVDLSNIETLVLDEADRMLDMGFLDDMKEIVAHTPDARQTLMFSATFEKTLANLAASMLKDSLRIDVANQTQRHENIEQSLLYADNAGHKFRLLEHILDNEPVYQAIVFTATKRSADDLAERLKDNDYKAAALHGDMNQRQRTRTITQLQNGKLHVLVATDVAARGIDVQGISHAINFDLPMQAEDYVHRIGRTGRAGRDGRAYSFATFAENFKVKKIERFTGQTIEVETIEGLEPVRQSSKPKNTSSNNRRRKAGNGAKRHSGARQDRNFEQRSDSAPRNESRGRRSDFERLDNDSARPEGKIETRSRRYEERADRQERPRYRQEGQPGRQQRASQSPQRSRNRDQESAPATAHQDGVRPSRKLRKDSKSLIERVNRAVTERMSY